MHLRFFFFFFLLYIYFLLEMRKSKSRGEGFVLSPSSACETTILYHMIIFLFMEEVGQGNEIKGLSFLTRLWICLTLAIWTSANIG